MKKHYVIFVPSKNKYYTGRYWGTPFSADIEQAHPFDSIEAIDSALKETSPDSYSDSYTDEISWLIDNVKMFEVRTIYSR